MREKTSRAPGPLGYAEVLEDVKRLIADSRRRAAAAINRELVSVYWHIGRVIVTQQETARWGDAVVEQLSADLRAAFPDLKGFTKENVFRMRKFFLATREIDAWRLERSTHSPKVATLSPQLCRQDSDGEKVATPSPQFVDDEPEVQLPGKAANALSREFGSSDLAGLIPAISWSHHKEIIGAVSGPAERFFYMAMSARERWSVRELRRQIDAALFVRYMSVNRDPEKCLPEHADSGELLPFKDHYVLEFLGLEEEHSELQLRKAILDNLRDFFLEFGKDLTFAGEEYPLTVGSDTFYIDLLFFHRRLRCLIAIDLKKGKFKPEYAGKSCFYCAALDEFIKLPDENPSLGLVLCRSADAVQVRLALTEAAEKIGVATYQTALPNGRLIRERMKQLPELLEGDE